MHQHDDHHHPDVTPSGEQDAAGAALTDALRASFRVLKAVMVVVFLLYLLSGTVILDQNEQAVVFRFGRVRPQTRGPRMVS